MACCPKAPSHYPNQCWFTIIKILWLSSHSNVYLNTQDNYPQVVFRPGDNELKSQKGVNILFMEWCKPQSLYKQNMMQNSRFHTNWKKCCSLTIINRVHVRGKANDWLEYESGAWNIVASRMVPLRSGSVRQQWQYGMEFKSHRKIKNIITWPLSIGFMFMVVAMMLMFMVVAMTVWNMNQEHAISLWHGNVFDITDLLWRESTNPQCFLLRKGQQCEALIFVYVGLNKLQPEEVKGKNYRISIM